LTVSGGLEEQFDETQRDDDDGFQCLSAFSHATVI
jgi:hypothetical protein